MTTGTRKHGAYLGHTGVVAEERKPTDQDTLSRIRNLVAEEKTLREQLVHKDITESQEHARLLRVETELDQCWDLLRQRRALRETGGDPREARVRPPGQVEGYLS
jgi:hypothetical protein